MAGRGPLPKPKETRRNKTPPAIATTSLPAGGREGDPPDCPYELGGAGESWWRWAWSRPQAAAWDDGALFFAARRAKLEDAMATLEFVDKFDLAQIIGTGEDEQQSVRILQALLMQMKALATGLVTLMRECRELDNRLGLNPKAMSELRWAIAADEPEADRPLASVSKMSDLRRAASASRPA